MARNTSNSDAIMPSGSTGTFGLGRGVVRGINSDSAVVSVALQEAFADADADAPEGVHVTALPSAVVPFMNCTVPLGPALLLLPDDTVAVSVTLPPDATLVGVEVIAVVVVACVMVTATVLLVVLELKLLFGSAVYIALSL